MQLLDGLKGKWRYWKLKEEALDRTPWRTRCRRGYEPVVRQTAECMRRREYSKEWSDWVGACGVWSEHGVSRVQVGLLPYRLRFLITIPSKSIYAKQESRESALHFSMCIDVFPYVYTRGCNAPMSNKITFAWQILPWVSITKFYLNPLSVSQHVTNAHYVTSRCWHCCPLLPLARCCFHSREQQRVWFRAVALSNLTTSRSFNNFYMKQKKMAKCVIRTAVHKF